MCNLVNYVYMMLIKMSVKVKVKSAHSSAMMPAAVLKTGGSAIPTASIIFLLSLSATKGPCEEAAGRSRPAAVGAYVPQCTDDGYFLSSQCHGSIGHCWCVSREGVELEGTRSRRGKTPVDCDATGKGRKNVESCSNVE